MFLVCDKTNSERGISLREKILHAGYPCAFCVVSEISNYLPLWRIITFIDVFDDVRRTPYDNVRVLVIGNGFVNSALNADRIDSEDEVLPAVTKAVHEYFHVQPDWFYQFGVFYDDGVFISDDYGFFLVFGNMIVPTKREFLIYKYLQMTARACDYSPAERVCRFCWPTAKIPKSEKEASQNIAVHVMNLNRKSMEVMSRSLIETRRYSGYRLNKDI